MYIRGGANVKILAGDGDDHIDGDFRYLDAGSGDDFVEIYGSNNGYLVDYLDGGLGTDKILFFNSFGNSGGGSTDWTNIVKNFEIIQLKDDGYDLTLGNQATGNGKNIEIDGTTRNAHGKFTVSSSFAGNITFKGASGVDNVTLGSGNDVVTLGAGDDIVNAGNGNDSINGGEGKDIAIFSGKKNNYTITKIENEE